MAALDKIADVLEEEPRFATSRARSRFRASRGMFASKASGSATATGRRFFTASTSTSRPEPRSPSSDTADPQVRPSPSCSRASTTHARAESRSTGTTCVRSTSVVTALYQLGIVPQEGFLLPGTVSREHRVRGCPDAPPEDIPSVAAETIGAHDVRGATWRTATRRSCKERGTRLSTRSAAARRARLGPCSPILGSWILDEATSIGRHPAPSGKIESGVAAAPRRPHRLRDRPPPLDDPATPT